jgi:hypothetical protein
MSITIDKLVTKSHSGDAPPPKACHVVDEVEDLLGGQVGSPG